MKIEVFGTGCAKCQKTVDMVKKALEEAGVEAELSKVEEVNEIVKRGVMITPAVMVDGELKVEGKVPGIDEIMSWFE
ncbi:MAG: thioredoxin family protein [Halanaerobium sp.]|nr:thioredoxin family protein [Halanaerobium sp.]